MSEKKLHLSALAKEVYLHHVAGGGDVPASMLPIIERNAPKFSSSWAANCCTSMTLSLHFAILGAIFKKIRVVGDADRPLEVFSVVEVFSGVHGKEHVWNMVKLEGDEQWYSIDLSIEQYPTSRVTDITLKPWALFPSTDVRYPFKEATSATDVTTTHPLLPKVRCTPADATEFLTYWKAALGAVKTGFQLTELDEGQEVVVPVSPELVQSVTGQISAVLKRLNELAV